MEPAFKIKHPGDYEMILDKVTFMIENPDEKVRQVSDFTNTYISSKIFETLKKAIDNYSQLTEKCFIRIGRPPNYIVQSLWSSEE